MPPDSTRTEVRLPASVTPCDPSAVIDAVVERAEKAEAERDELRAVVGAAALMFHDYPDAANLSAQGPGRYADVARLVTSHPDFEAWWLAENERQIAEWKARGEI